MTSLWARPAVRLNRSSASRHGLTLIELTVVIAILAILAMLLAPRLAFLRTMSLHASAGTSLQDTMQNMLTFHASQAKWPHQFDSLISSADQNNLYGATTTTYGLDTALTSTANSGPLLTASTLQGSEYNSLRGLLGNLSGTDPNPVVYVEDHVETNSKPGNSGTSRRQLTATGAVAVINPNHNVNPSDPNAASGSLIYATVYPDGTPANERLIAMGVGPKCTAVSKTIVTPPACYMRDGTRYNRVIVVFRVRSDGVQASLAGAISPDGRTLDQCLGNYRVTAER